MGKPSRRDFVRTGTLAGLGVFGVNWRGFGQGLIEGERRVGRAVGAARPVVIASSNGLRSTERAMELLRRGVDTLDAVVEGVGIVEADPEDTSVGYGGLPNGLGVVQLDASVMHGPSRGAGAVAALEGFRHPSRVATAVMQYTDHVLLVGAGARDFALEIGFQEEDLLTDRARREWLEWRADLSSEDDYLTPPGEGEEELGLEGAQVDDGRYGTINCCAVNAAGDLSGVTSTSGLAFKVPGRVGDSPIVGAGLYVDNDVGAAGSTGRGESVIKAGGSLMVVEHMRRGLAPKDACLEALRRVAHLTVDQRLLKEDGRPDFNVSFYAVNKRGEHGAATMWSGRSYAVYDSEGNRKADAAYLFENEA